VSGKRLANAGFAVFIHEKSKSIIAGRDCAYVLAQRCVEISGQQRENAKSLRLAIFSLTPVAGVNRLSRTPLKDSCVI
jgi:hypothetical protein